MAMPAKNSTIQPLRAAQYLRMSTDHQQYSIVNQSAAIALYASAKDIVIVRSFVDSGKSGVCLKGRHALQDLIRTVQSGAADFQCILVYDVSRWGRFQDMDEAAHYEYLCKNAGIHIRYCAEQFENDNTMLAALLKNLKRMMAAEYSRELSAKVFAAQSRFARLGFNQGAPVVFGLRRLLVDSNSKAKQILNPAEHKAVQTDRVLLVPGPLEEVRTVRKIFDLCTLHRWTTLEIARDLNREMVKTRMGKEWTSSDVRRLISNPKYMGTYMWARKSHKLHAASTHNDPAQWVIARGAIEAAISPQQFKLAQSRVLMQRRKYTNEQLLTRLRRVWKKEGTLSIKVINQARFCPNAATFAYRFGRMANAYAKVGFRQNCDYDSIGEEKQRRRILERGLRTKVAEQFQGIGTQIAEDPRSGVLTLNGHLGVAVKVMHYVSYWGKRTRFGWKFKIRFSEGVQVLILACLDRTNRHIQAQYIIPKLARLEGVYWINEGADRVFLEACRADTLQPLLNSVAVSPLASLEVG
jgi:DNA invertase Pin-like site-specific DNA recombinase